MVKFTKSAVLEALDEILAETGPDYVYPRAWQAGGSGTCVYSDNGVPSCIIGRVIAKLDPELFEQVKDVEESRGSSWSVSGFNRSQEEYERDRANGWEKPTPVIEVEDADLIEWMRDIQSQQDQGYRYGRVIEIAKKEVGL